MYSFPSIVFGFHGCDSKTADTIISTGNDLDSSHNDYDWLGNGIYFWENNQHRALEYAEFLKQNPKKSKGIIKNPDVIGAIIDLGFCLNLLDSKYIQILNSGYELLKETHLKSKIPLPQNIPTGIRKLDCAVIETIHAFNKENNSKAFDSVRAVFTEGPELYPGAGFMSQSHIQICVRNPNCIKGYFRVKKENPRFPVP